MTIDTLDAATPKYESTALWVVNQEEEEEPYENDDYEDEDEDEEDIDEELGGTDEGGSGQSEKLY